MKLKALRENLNMTQAEVATKCDISNSTVARIEQFPERKPSTRIIKKIIKGLKVKYEDLF